MVLRMVLKMVHRTNANKNNMVKYQETIEWE